jgi:hypothetical protein
MPLPVQAPSMEVPLIVPEPVVAVQALPVDGVTPSVSYDGLPPPAVVAPVDSDGTQTAPEAILPNSSSPK